MSQLTSLRSFQGNSSMSRLDDLLSRNELIYQNLKLKLRDINRSNDQIHQNISHLQYSLHQDYNSQNSSAIQKQEDLLESQSIGKIVYQPKNKAENQRREVLQSIQEQYHLEEQSKQAIRPIDNFDFDERHNSSSINYLKQEDQYIQSQEKQTQSKESLQKKQSSAQLSSSQNYQVEKNLKYNQSPLMLKENRQRVYSMYAKNYAIKLSPHGSEQKQKSSLNKNNSVYLDKMVTERISNDGSLILMQEDMPTFRNLSKSHFLQKSHSPKSQSEILISDQKAGEEPFDSQADEISNQFDQNPHETSERLSSKSQIHQSNHSKNFDYDGLSKSKQIITQNLPKKIFRDITPCCCLFVPFNKLFRSPIIQVKLNQIILQRKSKTTNLAASNQQKIINGLSFKLKNIITDEQNLIKQLFYNSHQRKGQTDPQNNRIGIFGGKDTLKKKIHMGLLAYSFKHILELVKESNSFMLCNIEHQEIHNNQHPILIESSIEIQVQQQKIAAMKLQKTIEEIYQLMRKVHIETSQQKKNQKNSKILRMSKIVLFTGKNIEWNINIVSSNRYDYQFIGCLELDIISWCINPLVKNYEEVEETLQSIKKFTATHKNC